MRRNAVICAGICAALFLGFWPVFQEPIELTIRIPGWWPLAGLCGGLFGLYLIAIYHRATIAEYLNAVTAWLDDE